MTLLLVVSFILLSKVIPHLVDSSISLRNKTNEDKTSTSECESVLKTESEHHSIEFLYHFSPSMSTVMRFFFGSHFSIIADGFSLDSHFSVIAEFFVAIGLKSFHTTDRKWVLWSVTIPSILLMRCLLKNGSVFTHKSSYLLVIRLLQSMRIPVSF